MLKRIPTNQLWFQFSLAFATFVLIGAIIFFTIGFFLRPERISELPEAERVVTTELRIRVASAIARSLLLLTITGGAVGIGAGIWMSRRLTAPLDELATGVQQIGARNLSYRVDVEGSEEVTTLAQSFNQMASDLEEAEQLRQNLLADVAHELRTPLTVLQGNLRAMLDGVYELNQEEVMRLYDQTTHLHRLINDLHELAQAEARQLPLNQQQLELGEHVQMTVEMVAPLAETEEIALQIDLPEAPVHVWVDPLRLTQVLENLLTNALRHTPAEGQIEVRLQRRNKQAILSVTDNGEGIAPENLPRVFDRFYRTADARDRHSGGTGLGLAIVRAMVEAHGGTVQVASPGLGQGCTFTIQLPIADGVAGTRQY